MQTLKRLLRSRTTTIALMGAIFVAIIIASFIPQTFLAPPAEMAAWMKEHHRFVPFATAAGLFHVYTTVWFSTLLGLALLSLSLSSVDQFRQSWRRMFAGEEISGSASMSPLSPEAARHVVRRHGYWPVGGRFVKHPGGYWGNFFLHFGMVVVIASSLYIALTQKRGSLALFVGQLHAPTQKWTLEESGRLAGPFRLPAPVRLDEVRAEYWGNYKVKSISSELAFVEPVGEVPLKLTVNEMKSFRWLHVYQSTEFGAAFFLEVRNPDGKVFEEFIALKQPDRPDRPSYGDFQLARFPGGTLSAKYFADAAGKAIESGDPLLVLRTTSDGVETGRVTLRKGQTALLGTQQVTLRDVSRWTKIIFVDISGVPGVFTGLFVMILGGVLQYCFPPREVTVVPEGEGSRWSWRAGKFAGFYLDERERLAAALSGKRS